MGGLQKRPAALLNCEVQPEGWVILSPPYFLPKLSDIRLNVSFQNRNHGTSSPCLPCRINSTEMLM
jgi:hypothetical protein